MTELHLKNEQVCCDLHREPFFSQWPLGWDQFKAMALEELLHNPEFAEACGRDELQIPGLLDTTPVCCRLHKDIVLRLYLLCGIGCERKCVNCKQRAWGTSWRTNVANGRYVILDHVCFVCVTRRMVKSC